MTDTFLSARWENLIMTNYEVIPDVLTPYLPKGVELDSDNYEVENTYYKEHPLNGGYSGNKDERDWITEEVWGYYPSFFAYWKKVEKHLHKSIH
jgi:Uncharacterized conserved protein (COG2071)